jgi:CHASE2 domain-containing sensor protein
MINEERTWRDYINYFIVALVSVVALAILPFIGSEVGLAVVIPTTTIGWIVFVATKCIVVAINLAIFHCLTGQAKINVRGNPRYVEAQRLLHEIEDKTAKVLSPKEYFRKMRLTKYTTTTLGSLASVLSLGYAVLTFDLATFISYAITLCIGIVSGVLNMKEVEEFWTNDYYIYAVQQHQAIKQSNKETNNDNNKQ